MSKKTDAATQDLSMKIAENAFSTLSIVDTLGFIAAHQKRPTRKDHDFHP
jgi:hypothetical protein